MEQATNIIQLNDVELETRNAVKSVVEQRLELEAIEQDAKPLLESARALVVSGLDGEARAADLGVALKRLGDKLETRRTDLTGPLNNLIKIINNRCKAASVPIADSLTTLRGKITSYRRQEEERIAKEKRKADQEYERKLEAEKAKAKKKHTMPAYVPPPVVTAPANVTSGQVGSAIGRKVWRYRITDENKLPRHFLVPDESKIKAAVAQGTRNPGIPGVDIYEGSEVVFK